MKTKILLILIASLCCLGTVMKAQPLDSLLKIGVSVLDYEEKFDLSASTTVVTATEIIERGYDNLDELLSSVQGVHITHDGLFTQVGIRGISPTDVNNQRVLILVDNIPLNNPISGQSASSYDLRGINMEDIEEVVVIRSSSPVLNGNNAMLGLIKIKTKKAKKGLRLNFDTGSFGELDGGFAVGQEFGNVAIGISGRLATLPNKTLYLPQDPVTRTNTETFNGVGAKIDIGNLSINAFYNQRNEEIPRLTSNYGITTSDSFSYFNNDILNPQTVVIPYQVYNRQNSTAGTFQQQNIFGDISYQKTFKNKQSFYVRLHLNYAKDDSEWTSRDSVFFGIDSLMGADTSLIGATDIMQNLNQKSLWTGFEYQHLLPIGDKHQFTAGTEVWLLPFSNYNSTSNYDKNLSNLDYTLFDGSPLPPGFRPYYLQVAQDSSIDVLTNRNDTLLNERFSFWSFSVFAHDTYRINEQISLSGGLRVEINSRTKPIFAPQLSLAYTLNEKTNVRLGYSRGYRIPSFVETQIMQIGRPEPNLNLRTEFVNTYEISLKQQITKGFNLNLTTYFQQLDSLIDKVEKTIVYDNIATKNILGLEGGLSVDLPEGIKTYINYNFLLNKERLVNMPQPICKFGVTIPFLKHFTFYTEGQYEGSRLTTSGIETLPILLLNTNLLIRPKVAETNGFAKYLNQSYLSFRLYNVLDQFYQHPVGFQPNLPLMPQNGRTWQGQLTLVF